MFADKKVIVVAILLFFAISLCVLGSNKPYKLAVTIPVETTLNSCDTQSAFDVWIDMIENAKKTINFGEFYLTNKKGERLEKVINKLKEAGERGVKIHFLLDKKMYGNSKPFVSHLKIIKNIDIAIFNWQKLTGGVHHAKYFVVDNKISFIGSQNFDWRALTHIHETGIKIEDENFASALNAIFEADFAYAKGDVRAYEKLKAKHFKFSDKYFLTGSPKEFLPGGVEYSLDTLISLINKANNKITIQLLNFSKKIYKSKQKFTVISDALIRAAKRGVKVEMLVSNWNKRKPAVYDLMELSKVNGIKVKFVNIPMSKKGFIPYARVIHSKVMRIDENICWIGTSNWAKGYFTESRNLEVVVKDKVLAKTLDCLFESLWASKYCEVVKKGKKYHPPKIY